MVDPPVTLIELVPHQPSLPQVVSALKSVSCGAIVAFEGMTRESSSSSPQSNNPKNPNNPISNNAASNAGDQSTAASSNLNTQSNLSLGGSSESPKVTELIYESYEEMFYEQVQKLVGGTREKWPSIVGVGVSHRLGTCPLGETGVVVAVSSPHRKEAFESCEYLITTIKSSAPIWKTEMFGPSQDTPTSQ